MNKVLIKKGRIIIDRLPCPTIEKNAVMIQVLYSAVSLGTEMAAVNNSKKTLWQKAKEKPEKVKKVYDKLLAEGPIKTLSYVQGELNVSSPTGYSISGKVIEVGKNVNSIKVGDYVAAAGATANHAEIVAVPEMLAVKLESSTFLKEASSVAIGSIAMHGVRRAGLQFGEYCVVVGTGIIGLLTIQMLVNAGVRVMAIDLDIKKLELAKNYGAEHTFLASDKIVENSLSWTDQVGVDAVIFTAATPDSKALNDSFKMCRKKAKVVLVGVSGMDILRENIYQKEIDFCISTSYGPGRYDPNYEQFGHDYPIGYVRWTEKRNMSEYLRMLSTKTISLNELETGIYNLANAAQAFVKAGPDLKLLNIIEYEESEKTQTLKINDFQNKKSSSDRIKVGVIGTGSFAKNITLPILDNFSDYFQLTAFCNRTGLKAKDLGEQYNVQYITTDPLKIFSDENIDLVVITTRHNDHGSLVLEALKHGKHVFVEKPLAINSLEIDRIAEFYESKREVYPVLQVGFNRRYAPIIQKIKIHTDKRVNPLHIHYRMNAGYLPYDHWVFQEGGRIIGEACHIIDLMTYLVGDELRSISTESIGKSTQNIYSDNKSIVLKYGDGSIAHIDYFSQGSKELPKEYMEIHFDQKSIIMDDYKKLNSYGISIKHHAYKNSEKGHKQIIENLGEVLSGDRGRLIPLNELISTTKATLLIDRE